MILKLKNIQLSFTDSRGETFNLLNGVNLDVKRETVTALVGGNGTGKRRCSMLYQVSRMISKEKYCLTT